MRCLVLTSAIDRQTANRTLMKVGTAALKVGTVVLKVDTVVLKVDTVAAADSAAVA